MDTCFYQMIHEVQEGNEDSMLELINDFKPLFKKYAHKLNKDDAENDFTAYFIELIRKIPLNGFHGEHADKKILSYIKKSIINKYCTLVKAQSKDPLSFSCDIDCLPEQKSDTSIEDDFVLINAIESLTKLQKKVIMLQYFGGYSEVEIGRALLISRQSVNRARNRALENLRNYLS